MRKVERRLKQSLDYIQCHLSSTQSPLLFILYPGSEVWSDLKAILPPGDGRLRIAGDLTFEFGVVALVVRSHLGRLAHEGGPR